MSRRDDEFTVFVEQHRQQLLRAAYATTGGWTQAEDIVQIALVKLYRAWPRVDDSRGGAFAYARQIVLRSRLDEWRRPWWREVASGRLPERPASDRTQQVPDHLDLVAALRQLPRRQRQVIVARYYLEMSVEETASELGLATGTVKSHCSRGIAHLNAMLASSDASARTEATS